MGARYTIYRVRHELERKLGVLKKRHPINPSFKQFISLEKWRKETPPFFFEGKNISLTPTPQESLKKRVEAMKQGRFVLFGKVEYDLGKDYDWVTNPVTGYRYDVNEHWSTIADFSEERGDIKFVWEKSRFAFLTDIIRYDFHFQEDQSEFVFGQIIDFIEKNPINCGPNYRCSQEISLRTMNWTLALYYYKDAPNLTEERFEKIMHAIYWQLHHIYHHIDFSRIAVRNNHAITETLMLYLSGLLFPFLPDTAKWSKEGEKWFQQEVEYQIYPDGTFLQFSMNYHRVVVQLLTWGLRLADLHGKSFSPIIKERAALSLKFLDVSSDSVSGKLPNYGNNDGALFYKWTEDDFRVYTSQLNDLRAVLENSVSKIQESQAWYGLKDFKVVEGNIQGVYEFQDGGYYIHQEDTIKTFLRCGSYKDRPSQSDNLHLDIFKDGINYLWDNGTYKYNTDKETVDYFTGCEGHNTLSLEGHNQMLRGGRFIWYYWIKRAKAKMSESAKQMIFEGEIEGFQYLEKEIIHSRKVEKNRGENQWLVTDKLSKANGKERSVYWHVNPEVFKLVEIQCKTLDGKIITPKVEEKWHSSYYGVKEKGIRYSFRSQQTMITTITLKET
ncbi:hypothetical protein KCTC52924_02963 [Arenibacter antarcticus]|uniref:Heparinase II/III family protein n=2 Tax=Flavobacteriaceae TaxID=49546 RepID=A0ABW5VGU6_9FLAO|nr:heparinase [Arenibacter sp. H213]